MTETMTVETIPMRRRRSVWRLNAQKSHASDAQTSSAFQGHLISVSNTTKIYDFPIVFIGALVFDLASACAGV